MLLPQMENVKQKDPAGSVIGYDGDKVIDGRYERSGCDGRVDVDLLEEQRYQSTDCRGYDHGEEE